MPATKHRRALLPQATPIPKKQLHVGGAGKAGGFTDHNKKWLKPKQQQQQQHAASSDEEDEEDDSEGIVAGSMSEDDSDLLGDDEFGELEGEEGSEEEGGTSLLPAAPAAPAVFAAACLQLFPPFGCKGWLGVPWHLAGRRTVSTTAQQGNVSGNWSGHSPEQQ